MGENVLGRLPYPPHRPYCPHYPHLYTLAVLTVSVLFPTVAILLQASRKGVWG